MTAKLFFDDLEMPVRNSEATLPWRALGLVTAFAFSALVWLGLFSAISYFV